MPSEAAGGSSHDDGGGDRVFQVRLGNFSGPFDLLLQLISRHKLDVTEVALSQVTDDFLAHIKTAGAGWDLEQTSSFLVVAATLLDLKAARLIPSGEVEDAEDLAVLEARDLLFARLLAYRAFKQVAAYLAQRIDGEGRRHPRQVALEPRFARLLPEPTVGVSAERFAQVAARLLMPRPAELISLAHLHAPAVSVREQAALVAGRLRRSRVLTFRALAGDSPNTITTVARFLALLELFRDKAVSFAQAAPLAELTIRWTGSAAGEVVSASEFDQAEPPAGADGREAE